MIFKDAISRQETWCNEIIVRGETYETENDAHKNIWETFETVYILYL
jgi:hypothetical protein